MVIVGNLVDSLAMLQLAAHQQQEFLQQVQTVHIVLATLRNRTQVMGGHALKKC
jgi:hypothetical protein